LKRSHIVFQRILVPLDGSALAEHALSVGSRIARFSGASLTLLRVVNSLDDVTYLSRGSAIMNLADIIARDHAEAAAYLKRIASRSDLAGIEVITHVVEGNPAQSILYEARTYAADLIIMCSHGDTGLKRWMFGSVSLHVARHCAIPVFVLRPGADGTVVFPQTMGQVRIMVPLDGSTLAEEIITPAIALTTALSAPRPGALHFASVVPFFTAETTDELDQIVKAAQEYLVSIEQQLLQREDTANLTITSSVTVLADVAHSLVELAETGKGMELIKDFTGCGMVAMSTHGRSGIMHWMMGSIAERVLASTKLPMLIVRPQEIRVKQQSVLDKKDADEVSTNNEAEFPSWVGLL
jgi:nucleotide-binding universal stress UspA family protein